MARKGKDGLTDQQRLFADTYLADPEQNATKAYVMAYPKTSESSAHRNAWRLLANEKVSAYIHKRKKRLLRSLSITQERVLREMASVAFFDPRKLFHPDGTFRDLHELDDDTAACIAGVHITAGKRGRERTRKIKFISKITALDQLARYLGLYERDNEQQRERAVFILKGR